MTSESPEAVQLTTTSKVHLPGPVATSSIRHSDWLELGRRLVRATEDATTRREAWLAVVSAVGGAGVSCVVASTVGGLPMQPGEKWTPEPIQLCIGAACLAVALLGLCGIRVRAADTRASVGEALDFMRHIGRTSAAPDITTSPVVAGLRAKLAAWLGNRATQTTSGQDPSRTSPSTPPSRSPGGRY